MDDTLYNGQCRECGAAMSDCRCQKERIKELEEEVARLKQKLEEEMRLTIGISDKAMAYDALREKFPFLPGDEFWTLFQDSVTRWTVEKIWFNSVDLLCLNGYRERQNGSILESPKYKASECHPTAEACRNAIKVEE